MLKAKKSQCCNLPTIKIRLSLPLKHNSEDAVYVIPHPKMVCLLISIPYPLKAMSSDFTWTPDKLIRCLE